MILGVIIIISTLLLYRAIAILPHNSRKTDKRLHKEKTSCSVAVFLGSGGHTGEALSLMSALNIERYSPRTYIVCSGDDLSVQKVVQFESRLSGISKSNYSVLVIPRARRVHQALLTTPISVVSSLTHCVYHLTFRPLFDPKSPKFADALVLNGPGTCFVLCLAVYINKFLGLQAPLIIYVETFARIRSTSLSGKLIRPFADRFVTQWSHQEGSLQSNQWLV